MLNFTTNRGVSKARTGEAVKDSTDIPVSGRGQRTDTSSERKDDSIEVRSVTNTLKKRGTCEYIEKNNVRDRVRALLRSFCGHSL